MYDAPSRIYVGIKTWVKQTGVYYTTVDDGSLGSYFDEERNSIRKVDLVVSVKSLSLNA